MIEHNADRPAWECWSCGKAWPCESARAALLAEFEKFPTVLRIYLVAQMTDAAREIPAIQPPELYDRFLAWSR